MAVVFVDESGSFLPQKTQRYFVVSTFTVGDPKRTAKAFQSWKHQAFPKRKRFQSEIKFSETGISDELRLRTIKYISSLDVRIRFGYLLSSHLPHFSYDHKGLREGYLYTQIVGEILESYFPNTEKSFMVRCDKRQLKSLKKGDFIELLRTRLLPIAQTGVEIDIKQVDSVHDTNIQIADWIVGALAAFLNKKPLGKQYYDILKENIIGSPIELFASKN